jgi:caffeoyl-CoA O-methyltransferase
MAKFVPLDDRIWNYIAALGPREAPVLAKLREATARLPGAGMQIAADQGAFMQLLARLIEARRYLEIGVYTGYSSLAVALAQPPDGEITACDRSHEYTMVARKFWREAGVDKKIDLRIAPALQTLEELVAEDRVATYDMAFIDADKGNQFLYFERCLQLVRPGGLILVDNSLWGGAVADPARTDNDTDAIREANARIMADPRVEPVLLAIGDGLLLARRIS